MNNNSIVDYLNTTGQASDFSSRKKLAESSGISNYMGSADQNIQLLNTLKAKAPATNATTGATTPTQAGAITVDQMKPATPIKSVPTPVDATNYAGIGTAATSSTAKAYEEINKLYQTLQTKNVTDATSISSTMEKLLGKSADTIQANETAGVNSATEELNKYLTQIADINAQSSVLDKEASAIPLILQEKVAGQGVTDAGLAPEQAGELRKNAIKRLELSAKADIVSAGATGSLNKLTLAKEKAQQIIDLKYKPLEDNLNIRLKQYELNKDILSTISKERTEALDAKLKEETAILSYYKDKEKAKSDLIVKAAPYAPAALLERASNAPDAQSAAIILGTYAGDYLAQQKLNQEIIKLKIENGTYNMNDATSLGVVSKDNGFTLEDFKRGIGMLESSQNYSALGKIMETGMYKGDRAYGKYQVMGKNIPEWTQQALGRTLTPQQFLASPEAQEKVFEYRSELAYAKYGNWDDVASVWFSGQPAANNMRDDGQTNVPDYIKKMRKFMGVTEKTQVQIDGYSPQVINAVTNGLVSAGQLVTATTGQVPKNIGAEEQKGVTALRDLIKKMDEYKTLYTELQGEGVTGVFGTGIVKGLKNSIAPSVNATALSSLQDEIVDLLSRARSGAALSVVEEARYAEKLPTSYSADSFFGNPQVEIDSLKSSLEGTLNSKLSTYGVTFAPTAEDIYFAQMKGAITGTTSTSSGGGVGGYSY